MQIFNFQVNAVHLEKPNRWNAIDVDAFLMEEDSLVREGSVFQTKSEAIVQRGNVRFFMIVGLN